MTTEQLSSPRNDWPQVLLDALRLVNSSLDFGRVMELVLEGAMQVVKAEAGAVIMLDEDADELVIRWPEAPRAPKPSRPAFHVTKALPGGSWSRARHSWSPTSRGTSVASSGWTR